MAWNARWTLQAVNKAKKSGDLKEVARLNALVDAVQARCKHDGPVNSQLIREDSKNGKYKAGGRLHWCQLCGKTTQYEAPEALQG